MRMVVMVAACVVLACPAPGVAQSRQRPPRNCGEFACSPRPSPGPLPSDEALALGRRIVMAVDLGAVARRNAQLVALGRAMETPRPRVPTYPDGPIRAVPPVDLADYPAWGIVMQQRVIDHAALHYARKYSLDELKAMAAFFESSGGKKLAQERESRSAEVEYALQASDRVLREDLWNVVCGRPAPQEVEDAPHHQFHRLHPPFDFPLPPRPAWCSKIPAE